MPNCKLNGVLELRLTPMEPCPIPLQHQRNKNQRLRATSQEGLCLKGCCRTRRYPLVGVEKLVIPPHNCVLPYCRVIPLLIVRKVTHRVTLRQLKLLKVVLLEPKTTQNTQANWTLHTTITLQLTSSQACPWKTSTVMKHRQRLAHFVPLRISFHRHTQCHPFPLSSKRQTAPHTHPSSQVRGIFPALKHLLHL
jgi:hypothetical protein